MSQVRELSVATPNLLIEEPDKAAKPCPLLDGHVTDTTVVHTSSHGAPVPTEVAPPHELLAKGSLYQKTVEDLVENRRLIAGHGQAEQFISEVYAASQINRGPPGIFKSSRLHLDMLLNRDSMITPADYLNFDYNFSV